MEQGNLLECLPWLTEAVALDQDDPERVEMHRRRLGAVLRQCPKLSQVLFVDGRLDQASLSPDGRQVLTRSGSQVWVWDVGSGRPVAKWQPEATVAQAAFSPDGRRVAACGRINGPGSVLASVLWVWDVASGKQLLHHAGLGYNADHVEFSPDGRLLLMH